MFADGPDKPTHFGATDRSDVLNIVVLKEVSLLLQLSLVSALNSDYNPVLSFFHE